MQTFMPEETLLELDKPKEGETMYEELFGSDKLEPSGDVDKVYNVFYPTTIFNQGTKPITRMACSRYGIIHAINAQNLAVAAIDKFRTYEYNPEVMWENFLKTTPNAEQEGATLQGALEQMVELSLITGYSRVTSIEQMKEALRSFRPLYTGSKNCNWATVRDFKRYELGTGYAHIFCIVGFDGS
jgi:hypothetical protein